MFLTLTLGCSCPQAFKKLLRVARCISSGKTWMIHSIKYSWAIGSRHETTCSSTPGKTVVLQLKVKVFYLSEILLQFIKSKIVKSYCPPSNLPSIYNSHINVYIFQLGKSNQVCSNQNSQLHAFPFLLLSVPRVSLQGGMIVRQKI